MIKLLFIFMTFLIPVHSFALNDFNNNNELIYNYIYPKKAPLIFNGKLGESPSNNYMIKNTNQSKYFNFNVTNNQEYRQYLDDRQEQFYQGGTRALNHYSDNLGIIIPFN